MRMPGWPQKRPSGLYGVRLDGFQARTLFGQRTKCGHWDALGELDVFSADHSTWTNDGTLTALAMAHARRLGLDHIWDRRKMHDDWREWVYLAIMDYLWVKI